MMNEGLLCLGNCGICQLHVLNFELVLFCLKYKYELNICQLQISVGKSNWHPGAMY